jgi:uncharacterized membrane protein
MEYITIGIIMLFLDSIYLSTIGGNLFGPMVNNIQNEKMTLNLHGAFIAYVLLLLVIYKFIIKEKRSPKEAFILGLCIYGIYDFTNMAIFKKYEYLPAIVDTIWGGTLFYLTTCITYNFIHKTN